MSLIAEKDTDVEAADVSVDGAGGSVGPSSLATGALGEAVGVGAVDEAVTVAICCVAGEEACEDCEGVSGPDVKDVSV